MQNPGFPNPYASSASASAAIAYRVEKASEDVCQLRMDLESFTLRATGQTSDYDVTAVPNEIAECIDTFDIQVRNNYSFFRWIFNACVFFFKKKSTAYSSVPTICGENSGQHSEFPQNK